MNQDILNENLQRHRLKIEEEVKNLHQLTIDIGNDEMALTVSDLRQRITEPFMFVIVGEVKAGKSSFINALLETGEEVCKVAPDPCTDTIQQIIYAETPSEFMINEHLKKIMLPVDILKDIAIVDTPGTNTISEHHQEITEQFVPASDLIVFVFEAKNPYRESAWKFFDYIHEDWRKKIIFVLQQSDLMEADDLIVNLKGVDNYAAKKGIMDPLVFAVSAKLEQKGEKEASGFEPVRAYIRDNITGGQAPILKLLNNIATSKNVNGKIKAGLDLRQAQLKADLNFREDVKTTLDEQEVRSNKQVDVLVENLVAGYDRITNQTKSELETGLGFPSLVKRSFMSMFSKKESVKVWLDEIIQNLEHDLSKTMTDKLQSGVTDIAESIQQMARIIELKLKNSKSILKDDHEIFGNIAEKRGRVLHELQEQFTQFINRSESFMDKELFDDENTFSPNIATGSGLAVIGVILATVTQTAVFDITGGILAAIGFLFAGVTVGIQRRKVMEKFNDTIDKGRREIEGEVESKLKTYTRNIKGKIDDNFKNFDAFLDVETESLTKIADKHSTIVERLNELEIEVKKEMPA